MARPLLLLASLTIPVVLGSCGARSPAGSARAPGGSDDSSLPSTWTREVAPFPVFDEHGRPYGHPFLGGLVVPRPQFVDWNGDGRFDLFVQERSGELMHLENIGTDREPRFAWRTDRFQELDIGEWFLFADLDGDGRVDLLAEERFSYIRVFRSGGPQEDPRFELLPDTLRDVSGRPIFADRQNIPALIDLECDGKLDLFLGRVDGTIVRYREVDRAGEWGLPRFELVTDRFEDIAIVGQVGTLHGANSMSWLDLDGNGALDLFWGDFFEPGLLLMRNTEPCPGFSVRSAPELVPTEGEPISTSGFNVPRFADLWDRGREDLFVGVLGGAFNPNTTASANFHHYARTADHTFELVTERFLAMIDVGSESSVAFADLTGNGLSDMVVGNRLDPARQETGRLYLFLNRGRAGAPELHLADTLSVLEAYHQAPAFGDLFGDGRPHLAVGTWNDGIHFFRNASSADELRFESQPELTVRIPRGSHTVPALADLTGDGLLDLVVGQSSGELSFYRNTGTPAAPRYEWVEDGYQGIDVGRRSAPSFVDLDGDGLPDLVVGSESGVVFFYRNVGTRSEARFELDESLTLTLHRHSTPILVDLDGDGRFELFSGGLSGGVQYYRGGG